MEGFRGRCDLRHSVRSIGTSSFPGTAADSIIVSNAGVDAGSHRVAADRSLLGKTDGIHV